MMRLVLIDGHAILHRAFHALPPLTTSQNQEVGAVFGFCSMLLRVIQDLKPEYLVVAFDLPKPTFRQKLYKPYQAQRPQMAEELSSQVQIVHQVLKTMGISIFEKEGYEADDLIGTLAQKAKKDLEVIIVTGDRDMLQLVNSRVKVYVPIKGITQTVLYDEEAVEEKYGLKPSQWVDFKALIGDPSDNYPGASGIGPKTAATLLNRYGSIRELYKNLKQLSERQAKVLVCDADKVELAKKLATIVTDAPIKADLEKCRLKDLKNIRVEELFRELEFKSLWERLAGGNSAKKTKEQVPQKIKEEQQLKLI